MMEQQQQEQQQFVLPTMSIMNTADMMAATVEDNSTIATYSFSQLPSQSQQQPHQFELLQLQQQQYHHHHSPTVPPISTTTGALYNANAPYSELYHPPTQQQQHLPHPFQWQQQQQHVGSGMMNDPPQSLIHQQHQQFLFQQQQQQQQQQQSHQPANTNYWIPPSSDVVGHTTVATQTSSSNPTTTTHFTLRTNKVFYPPLLASTSTSSALKTVTSTRTSNSPNFFNNILGKTKPKVIPGRLFVRINGDDSNSTTASKTSNMNIDRNSNTLSAQLGDFTIAIKYAEIEADIIDRARRRLLKKVDKKEAISNRRRSQYRWTATTSTTTEGGKGGGGGGGPVNTTVMGKVYELGKGSGAMEQQQQQQRRDDVNEFGVDRGRRNATPDLEERGRILSEEPKLAYLEISHTASPSNSVAAATASVSGGNANSNDSAIPTNRRIVWSSSPGVNFVGASSLSSIDIVQSNDNNGHDDTNATNTTTTTTMGHNSTTMMVETFNRIYSIQTVDCIRRGPRSMQQGRGGREHQQDAANHSIANDDNVEEVVTISGQLGHEITPEGELLPSKWNNVRYSMEFSLVTTHQGDCNTSHCRRGLRFKLRVEGGGVCDGGGAVGMKKNGNMEDKRLGGSEKRDTSGSVVELDYTVNSAHLFLKSLENEAYFGLGARMSRSNLRGMEVHVCHPTTSSSSSSSSSSAGGGGRNPYSTKSTNSSSTMPHFITSSGTSLHLHNTEPSVFDFTHCSYSSSSNSESNSVSNSNSGWYSIRVPCSILEGTFLVGTSPLHACELHTSMVGRAPLIPKWAQERGIFVGLTGGTLNVHRVCNTLFKHKALIAGVLIKDWTGIKCNHTTSLPTGGSSLLGGPVKNTGLLGGGKNNGNNAMWYNWVLERAHYPKWQSLVDSLERRGISVGLYLCPYVEEIPKHLNSGRRHLFAEVIEDDYFVKKKLTTNNGGCTIHEGKTSKKKVVGGGGGGGGCSSRVAAGNQDQDGSAAGMRRGTMMMYNQFKRTKCGILDPTNFHATSWIKQAVREEVFDRAGASFWITDMGIGGPPVDGVYTTPNPAPDNSVVITTGMIPSGGESKTLTGGLSFHNTYAEKWAKVNRDILSDAGREGDAFFIMNTAFSSTAKYAGCTCLGDYIADFNNDGSTGGNGSDVLRAVLNGLVNGGFSGLTHGHCAVNFAVPRCLSNAIGHSIDSRSREMICRWLEMTAFTSFFRTHDGGCGARECEGNGNSMLNAQDDDVVLRSLARWSHVFVALSEYRLRLLNDASFKGYPVVRHPSMHYPNDVTFVGNDVGKKDDTSACSSTFMMGDLIYVAPVLKCGVVKSKVYLPQGAWIHLWSGDEVSGPHNFGKIVEVAAPIGEPPVFIRDSVMMHKFVAILRKKRIIKTGSTSPERKSTLFSSIRRRVKQ